jgi:hypothetical protein
LKEKAKEKKFWKADDSKLLDLKKFLSGQSLKSEQNTKDVVQDWLKGWTATFIEEVTQLPVPRHEKCPNLHGDCEENYFKLLKPTGNVMHNQFNIQQLYALPTLYLCVLYFSENKQQHLLYVI